MNWRYEKILDEPDVEFESRWTRGMKSRWTDYLDEPTLLRFRGFLYIGRWLTKCLRFDSQVNATPSHCIFLYLRKTVFRNFGCNFSYLRKTVFRTYEKRFFVNTKKRFFVLRKSRWHPLKFQDRKLWFIACEVQMNFRSIVYCDSR